jgi:hypothetical protein
MSTLQGGFPALKKMEMEGFFPEDEETQAEPCWFLNNIEICALTIWIAQCYSE